MALVYARIQANDYNYKDKISNELDEYNQGLTFDFNKSDNDDNIISVEYDNKLIALVEKQGSDYVVERISGTPQANKLTQAIEHGGEWLEKHFNLDINELTFKEEELEDVKGRVNLDKNIIYLNPLYKSEYNSIIEHELLHYALYTQGLEYGDGTNTFNTFACALGVHVGYVGVPKQETHVGVGAKTHVGVGAKTHVSVGAKTHVGTTHNNIVQVQFG